MKCLEKAPEHRYTSAEELANDLSRFRSGLPVVARPVPSFEKAWRWCRRNPAIASLSTIAVLLLLATTLSSVLLALSERNARINSDRNAQREKTLKNEVDAALVEERRTKSALHLANGIWRAETGNIPGALLWFAESARGAADNPPQLDIELRRWNSWYESHPRLVGSNLFAEGYKEVEKGGWDRVEFRALGNEVLIQAGSQYVVWNFEKDTVWDLGESCGTVTSAAWSERGDELAVGCSDGRVLRLNPETRDVIYELQTQSAVTQIVYSEDCQRLAVANSNELKIVDVQTGLTHVEFPSHPKRIVYLQFSPSGFQLVSVALDRKARLFDVNAAGSAIVESSVYRTKPTEYHQPFRPAFVHEGRSLLLRASRDQYSLFDAESGHPLDSIAIDQHMYSFSVKNDLLLLTGDKEAHVRKIDGKKEEITNLALPEDSFDCANPSLLSEPLNQMLHTYRTTNCDMTEGGLVATGNWDQNVRLWQVQLPGAGNPAIVQKKQLALLPHQTRVRKVQFSKDGRHLITIQIDGLARVFDLADSRSGDYRFDSPAGVNFVRLVGENRFVTTGSSSWYSRNANVAMRSFDSPEVEASTQQLAIEKDGIVMDAVCSLNNRALITLHSRTNRSRSGFVSTDGSAGSVRFWNWPECTNLEAEIALDSEPRWIEHHPFDSQVAVCTSKMDVVLIDTETQQIEKILYRDATKYSFGRGYSHFPQHPANQQLLYSPDGKSILVWSQYNVGAFVWDLETGKLKFPPFSNSGWPITGADFSPDGNYIVFAGGRSKNAVIVDADTGEQVGETLEHTVVCYNAHFNKDTSLIVTACRDGKARVFDWKTGELIHNDMNHAADVLDAVFSNDAKYILSISQDRKLKIWNADDGTIAIRPIEISRGSRHVQVTPDSRFAIVYGGHDYNSVIKLADDEMPKITDLDQAILASQLLANHQMQGSASVKINTAEWYAAWQEFNASRSKAER